MQAELNRICADLAATNLDQSFADVLTYMLPDTAKETLAWITERQSKVAANDATNYATAILQILKNIKKKADRAVTTDKMRCTGIQVSLADSMCLFVCGLLTHPSMSFLALTTSIKDEHKAYATEFLKYMISYQSAMIKVVEHSPQNTTAAALIDDKFAVDTHLTEPLPGTCFICARKEEYKNKLPKQTLVLDAFSELDQFVHYNPIAWHAYSLWFFKRSNPDPEMCCYGASSGDKSFIFMGAYDHHVKTTKQNMSHSPD
jgi:hypothetical protein